MDSGFEKSDVIYGKQVLFLILDSHQSRALYRMHRTDRVVVL